MIAGNLDRTGLRAYLATRADRCNGCGFAEVQGCRCEGAEWPTFVAALRASIDADGLIHQTDMRPRIQRIPHKHRGLFYRRARAEGLIAIESKEPSTDTAGRNGDKDQKVYRWTGNASQVAA